MKLYYGRFLQLNKLLASILLCFFLISCGFHLRGTFYLPHSLLRLYIQDNASDPSFSQQLKKQLSAAGTVLVGRADQASVTLALLKSQYQQQLTSQGSGGQMTTYLLSYTVTYQLLTAKGQSIEPAQVLSTTKNYSVNSSQVLGDLSVESQLKSDMQRELVYQLLLRLGSSKTQKSLLYADSTSSASLPS